MSLVSEILKPYNSLQVRDDKEGRQFHRLSNLVDVLDKSQVSVVELQELFHRFDKKRNSTKRNKMWSECSLACCHISWLGRLKGDDQLARAHQEFLLKNSSEGLLSSSEEAPEQAGLATFFLPSHERSVGLADSELPSLRKNIFETKSKRQFFQRIQSVLASTWPSLEKDISSNTLDANTLVRNEFLQFMHKQLLQNALTHAYAEALHNPNYTKHYLEHYGSEGADFLFGSLAFLEVRVLAAAAVDQEVFSSELSSFHPALAGEAIGLFERCRSRRSKIVAFSYCDTGPGIERHIRHFSPQKSDLPREFDIKFAIDNRIAGRSVARAGEGLSDIRKHSQESQATLVFETTDSSYLLSEKMGIEEVTNNSRINRGTSVSILFET